MKKIHNPFVSIPGYNCFGCSPGNIHGLQMQFFLDGETVVSTWEPGPQFQGYGNILHGGIQATMLDEIAGWVVMVVLKTAGVTSRMEVKYKRPVYTNQGGLRLKAYIREMKRHLAFVAAELYNAEEVLCAEAEVVYHTFPPEVAREKLNYPGQDVFFVP